MQNFRLCLMVEFLKSIFCIFSRYAHFPFSAKQLHMRLPIHVSHQSAAQLLRSASRIHFHCAFARVAEATFEHCLSSNYEEAIEQLGVKLIRVMAQFRRAMTTNVHILLLQVPHFIRLTGMPLGPFSEQVVEEQHRLWLPVFLVFITRDAYLRYYSWAAQTLQKRF